MSTAPSDQEFTPEQIRDGLALAGILKKRLDTALELEKIDYTKPTARDQLYQLAGRLAQQFVDEVRQKEPTVESERAERAQNKIKNLFIAMMTDILANLPVVH